MQNTALSIVTTLQNAGYTAYFAGGAVRDILLGIESDDIDIATNAKPEIIEDLFEKTFAIGKHFGVIMVEENGHHFEIATFRSDASYTDGRRPDAVLFTTPEEDAFRRDFTVNGMFYDPVAKKIHDFVGGQEDLKNKILRFIGNPNERIQEDHLRILRAVRFKNRFGLDFEESTRIALNRHASLIISVAAERVREELTKMLLHPTRSQAFRDLEDLEILTHIIPELSKLKTIDQPKNYHSEGDVFTHSLLVIDGLPENPNAELAWAALFHDIGKAETVVHEEDRIHFPDHAEEGERISKKILKRLKFSNYSYGKITWLVRNHHLLDQFDEMKWATKLHYYDHPFFEDLLHLHKADLFGCIPLLPSFHLEGEAHLKKVREEYEHAHFQNLLPSAQEELLDGKEIMEILNISPGGYIGIVKKALRDAQLNNQVRDKETAREWVRIFSQNTPPHPSELAPIRKRM